jgi:hypothetical protein
MSSVVIAGNTSGTITLDAPAVAGTTVLTLPATSGTVIVGSGGVTGVASGGTGANTLTANNVILGNGTSAVQFVAPGTTGNVLTSNGSTWTSAAGGGYAGFSTVVFEASGSWTPPSGITRAVITCMGGGGGGGTANGVMGGSGGFGIVYITGLSGTYTVTVGAGGAATAAGGTSSFGSIISCTGGGGGGAGVGTMGSATISSGTAIQNGAVAERFNDRGNAEMNQFGFFLYNNEGGTGANTWTKGQKFHPGIGGLGNTTAGSRKGGYSGLVVIQY